MEGLAMTNPTFPITFKTPESLMRFVGKLLEDDLIREATKMQIDKIEGRIKLKEYFG
jgi:hypothetical protein